MTDAPPSFDIPARPERRYPPTGGVEYEGGTAFHLVPEPPLDGGELDDRLVSVLDGDRYVRGDFFDLPAPVYLVHDRDASTSFRAVVRDGRLELHVLPATRAVALEALYERLAAAGDESWSIDARTDPP